MMAQRPDMEQREMRSAAQQVIAGQLDMIRDGDDWRRYLDFQSRLHSFSAPNVMLLVAQHQGMYEAGMVAAPLPAVVATAGQWQDAGRTVADGQRGMAILLADGGAVRVFSDAQTVGAALPVWSRVPRLLSGEAPLGLAGSAARLITSRGFTLRLDSGEPHCDVDRRIVTLPPASSEAGTLLTLLRLAGRVLLHEDTNSLPGLGDHVESDAVARVVALAHEMNPDQVAGGEGGDFPEDARQEQVRVSAVRVADAAHLMIDTSLSAHTGGGRLAGIRPGPDIYAYAGSRPARSSTGMGPAAGM